MSAVGVALMHAGDEGVEALRSEVGTGARVTSTELN
jgi:hypothetical protein